MTSYEKLIASLESKGNMLCVGLDTDISKMPNGFAKNISGVLDFNKMIIEATRDLAAAYKINFAFYEQYGSEGFAAIEKTLELLPSDAFTIADAKRGDIGNTSAAYAKSIFEHFRADSITVNPYMGTDSIDPFFAFEEKIVFILALTSNKGSFDYQKLKADGLEIYKHVLNNTSNRYSFTQAGYVVGATHPNEIAEVRRIVLDNVLLIPGVGAQGANASEVIAANGNAPALINVSRAISYPEVEGEYFDAVRSKAEYYANELKIK